MPPPSTPHTPAPDERPGQELQVTDPRLRRTVGLLCLVALVSYAVVVLVTIYTSWFDAYAFGTFSWAYVLGFGQFALAIGCGLIYIRVADRIDDGSQDV